MAHVFARGMYRPSHLLHACRKTRTPLPLLAHGIAEAVAFAARLQQGKDAVKAAQEAKRSAKVSDQISVN
eukprot:378186-Pelagomonas_calceolata.AAC.1